MKKNVSFIKTPEEVKYFENFAVDGVKFDNHEGLFVAWETTPEVVEKLVPAPLKPAAPVVLAYTAYFYENNFWKDYNEGGLFIPVICNGEQSLYCIAMPIAGKNDIPIFLGREALGFPKKNADELGIERRGNHVHVWIERNGIRFYDVEAEIGDFNTPEAEGILGAFKNGAELPTNVINFKYDISYDVNNKDKSVFTDVKLVESLNTFIFKETERAKVNKITLTPSMDDPWSELEVVQPLGAVYCSFGAIMGDSRIIAEVDADEYAPYLFAGWDSTVLGHKYRSFRISK